MKRASGGKTGGKGRGATSSRGLFFTLAEVAKSVGGRVLGDPHLRLTGIAPLDRAEAGDLSWLADPRRARAASVTRAGALLVAEEEHAGGRPAVVVANPTAAFALWLGRVRPQKRPAAGVSRRAHVDAAAKIGRGASVGAGAIVEKSARVGARAVLFPGSFVGERAVIGEDTWLYPNAAVLADCLVGDRCVLHAGAVVGSDGFGYVWDGEQHRKIPQVGIVRVEDDVEIGANSAIDRATLGETVIGRGTKIDNLVQVGHNVQIGEHSILCGQAGIAGSTRLGAHVTLAGQAGVGDHATLGDGSVATGRAGIASRAVVPAGAVLSGYPAAPHRDFLKRAALTARLPELVARLEKLEKSAVPGRGKRG
ncbi:MAG: UDP-3-O-(3-hydroxymyristoyl)glucosamine N-acyltransferase [Acidobacteriota bacterium]